MGVYKSLYSSFRYNVLFYYAINYDVAEHIEKLLRLAVELFWFMSLYCRLLVGAGNAPTFISIPDSQIKFHI